MSLLDIIKDARVIHQDATPPPSPWKRGKPGEMIPLLIGIIKQSDVAQSDGKQMVRLTIEVPADVDLNRVVAYTMLPIACAILVPELPH